MLEKNLNYSDMSLFSLSLWSSIKIFSNPYASSTKRKFASMPNVTSFNENKQQMSSEDEANQNLMEVVHLKIPEVLTLKENSLSSVSHNYSKLQTENNTLSNKLSKSNLIKFSKFSENCLKQNKELEDFVKINNQEEIEVLIRDVADAMKELEKELGDFDPEFESYFSLLYNIEYEETEMWNYDGKNPDWVPSVKHLKAPSCYCLNQGDPGLPLSRQSSSVLFEEWCESYFDCGFSTSESDLDVQFSSSLSSKKIELLKRMAKLSEENYYKSKLAQLHLMTKGS